MVIHFGCTSGSPQRLAATTERDAVVRSAVVASVSRQDVGHIADGALRVRIVLARAILPSTRVDDVDLPFGMGEAQEPARENGDRVVPFENGTVNTKPPVRGDGTLTGYRSGSTLHGH